MFKIQQQGGVECVVAGTGDITAVNGDEYITNGSATGDVNLVFNETRLNDTIDSRDTDTNETTRVNTITGADCGAGNYSYGFDSSGNIICREDQDSGATNVFDQVLNTTSNVTFSNLSVTFEVNTANRTHFQQLVTNAFLWITSISNIFDQWLNTTSHVVFDTINVSIIRSDDWSNVSITESQISNLVHTTDTNETTRFNALNATNCGGTDKVTGVLLNGTFVCNTDQTGAGGNPFNQVLNTTSNVTFFNVTSQNFLGSINASYVTNDPWLETTQESSLNTNSSGWWDNLNSPSDINAADITDDNTYATTSGDTFTGNVNISATNNLTLEGTTNVIFYNNGTHLIID